MPNEWIFAYGSNMHLDDLRRWLRNNGHATDGIISVVRATLRGYQLVWNYYSTGRQGGAANIELSSGANLPGVALEVTRSMREAIDEKEGCPRYYARESASLELDDGTAIIASIYVARAERCKETPQWPTRAYRDLMVEAAREHGLPSEHVDSLKRVNVRD